MSVLLLEKDEDAPLPLKAVRDRISAATYSWLQSKAREEAASASSSGHPDDAVGQNTVDLFVSSHPDDDEEDEYYPRVQEWSSSRTDPDGVGGYTIPPATGLITFAGAEQQQKQPESEEVLALEEQQQDKPPSQDDSGIVRVQYILSDAAGGHGDDLWAASRHVSNLLADPVKCRRLLRLSLVEQDSPTHNKSSNEEETDDYRQSPHPLMGKRFIELGAGGGFPSWTALHCGARVVCTDQPIADRIRALAEAAERNLQCMINKFNSDAAVAAAETALFQYASQAKVCPYSWGTPVNDLLNALPTTAPPLNEGGDGNNDDSVQFEVLVAADCIYMPECHGILLQSVQQLIKRGYSGVALLPFALHGNTPDKNVWSIVQSARDIGFCVERMEPQQLTPQSLSMDSKRALIHMLRLTLP